MKRVIICAALLTLAGCQSAEDKLQASVEQRVRDGARDPKSIEFRNVTVKNGVVCGEVNGANAMGGMTGFTPFAGDSAAVGVMNPDVDPQIFDAGNVVWTRLRTKCPGQLPDPTAADAAPLDVTNVEATDAMGGFNSSNAH